MTFQDHYNAAKGRKSTKSVIKRPQMLHNVPDKTIIDAMDAYDIDLETVKEATRRLIVRSLTIRAYGGELRRMGSIR